MRNFPTRNHPETNYVPKDLSSSTHIWPKEKAPKTTLSNRYNRPHEALDRGDKTVTLKVNGREDRISIDRVKPAFLETALEATKNAIPPKRSNAQEQTSDLFKPDTVVLANFPDPWWPVVVMDKSTNASSTDVRFFGTNKFAPISRNCVKPNSEQQTAHIGVLRVTEQAEDYLFGQHTHQTPTVSTAANGLVHRAKTLTIHPVPQINYF